MNLVLHTPRLTLRPLRTSDAAALNSIANQPHILKRMPDWKSTPEDTLGLIRAIAPHFTEATREKACVIFAVMRKDQLIGIVGVGNKQEADNEIELAFFIAGAHQRKGYAAEAARAVCRWAFDTLKLPYLIAIAEPDNIPSRRVLETCGFQRIETRGIRNTGETQEKPFDYFRLYSQ